MEEEFTRFHGGQMKLAIAQMQMSLDMDSNLKKAILMIREAALNGADLVLFPELMLTPFFPKYPGPLLTGLGIRRESFALQADDERIDRIAREAAENHIYCSPNLYIQAENGRLYDRSFLIDSAGSILGHSDMVNIYSAEHFNERDYYAPSEDGYRVYDTPFGKIGIVICFDRHIAESIRSCALQGALLILIPSANLTSEPADLFLAELRTESYQNNVFIAMANRTGEEDDVVFSGHSVVISPDGEVLSEADGTEQILYTEIETGDAVRSASKRPYRGFVVPDSGVYRMAAETVQSDVPSLDRLFLAMCDYDSGDPKRIQHFTKVWAYARLIGKKEHLTLSEQSTLEAAAIVHDIGIHKAEKDFGSTAGPLQEKLGAPEAHQMLTELGFPEEMTERVTFLVGHHHTYTEIDGRDYQILVEADFLVNLYEDGASADAVRTAGQKIFRTETGKALLRSMFPADTEERF